jgi:peptidoglycan/LPS O-acetylase OafA/YrhL
MEKQENRYLYMDSLRALAVLLVLWMHTAEIFSKSLLLQGHGLWMLNSAQALDFGRIGVITFFAISGFVIPSSLRGERWSGVRSFWIRRFFRLYPAYWLSILLGLVCEWWMWGRHISGKAVLLNFTMVPKIFGAPMVLSVYWTLQTELIFYVCCALLFVLGLLSGPRVMAVLCLLTGIAFFLLSWHLGMQEQKFRILGHLSIMFWGGLCRRRIEGETSDWLKSSVFYGALLSWGALLPWYALYRCLGHATIDAELIRFAGGYSLGILLFYIGTFVLRIYNRFLAWIGKISYSIYLFHAIVANLILLVILRELSHSSSAGLNLSAYLASVAVLSLLVAAAVYYLVENPAINTGKLITDRLKNNRRTPNYERHPLESKTDTNRVTAIQETSS